MASPDEIRVDDEVLLRWPSLEDAGVIYNLVDRNRDYLTQWMPWVPLYTSSSGLLPWISERSAARLEGIENPPLIVYKGSIAGGIGFYGRIDIKSKHCDVGYWIGEEFEGRGIVTRACRAVVGYAFKTLKMNRIQLRIAVENKRSHGIAHRLGMTYEGTLREELLINDKYQDMAVYSLLAREWSGSAC